MDYRLTDSRQDPVGQSEGYYCEKLIRLEPLSWCYLPWNEMPIRQSPLLRNGYVTFGSLNHPMKMNDEVISVWARILREVDQSQLVFRSRDADASGDRIVDRFVSYGIGPERLRPIGRQSLQKYLDCLSQVDVALDPFPYNGHVTSCDTLWMGVPLVTLIGRQAVSRIGADILANLEMNDLIAPNREDYVRTAVELARDGSRLDSLRSILRERMRASAIMDYPSLVERLERALRELWQTWCASPAGAQRTGSYR
jgi:predicted O-linked N-acetylglucosamine transferase (SPINDLY family)